MIALEVHQRQIAAWLHPAKAIRAAAKEVAQREDEAERTSPPLCAVCHGEVTRSRSSGNWPALCKSCRAEGYRTQPCKGCGGPTKLRDQRGPNKPEHKGYCGRCRMEFMEYGTEAMREGGRQSIRGQSRRADGRLRGTR